MECQASQKACKTQMGMSLVGTTVSEPVVVGQPRSETTEPLAV